MTDALVMFDHWYFGLADDGADQVLPTPGNNEVDQFIQLQHFIYRFPLRHGDDLNRGFRDIDLFQTILQDPGNGQVGMDRFRTSPQDDGVA